MPQSTDESVLARMAAHEQAVSSMHRPQAPALHLQASRSNREPAMQYGSGQRGDDAAMVPVELQRQLDRFQARLQAVEQTRAHANSTTDDPAAACAARNALDGETLSLSAEDYASQSALRECLRQLQQLQASHEAAQQRLQQRVRPAGHSAPIGDNADADVIRRMTAPRGIPAARADTANGR